MKSIAGSRWLWVAVPALAVAFVLAGCAPRPYVPPALPTAPAPAPPTPQVSRPVFYIKVNRLNLRACPGMDCPKISVLERGEEVEKVGTSEDWFQVRVKRDNRLGWVDSRYLSSTPVTAPEAAPSAAPVEVTPPALPEKIQPPPVEVTPPPLPEKIQPRPLPEKAAPSPVEKAKPPAAEEAAPPSKQKPEEAKPAKPAPEATSPAAKPAKAEAKPAPKEEKPAPPAQGTPQPSNPIRIM